MSETEAAAERVQGIEPHPWRAVAKGVAAFCLFLLAIRLMGSSLTEVEPSVRAVLEDIARDDVGRIGVGWLLTYLFTNGSVVAAVGVTVGASGVTDPSGTLSLVAGSRLGAAAFVLVVGGIDHLSRRGSSVRSSMDLGIIAFVVSHAVYIPATLLAYVALPILEPPLAAWSRGLDLGFLQPGVVHELADHGVRTLGPWPVVVVSIALLFGAILLFDRALRRLDPERVRDRVSFHNPWLSFAAGAVVTALTASMSFSIGVLVPLYNRGGLDRGRLVPYVLGANVATLLDTWIVALVLGAGPAAGAVLSLTSAALIVAAGFVVLSSRFVHVVEITVDRIAGTRTAFGLFLAAILLAPGLLLLLS